MPLSLACGSTGTLENNMLTRIQIMCMTPKTRLDFDGAKIERAEHSIHATTDKKKRSVVTQPARTRFGQTYPGGKHLRRSLGRLSARTSVYVDGDGKAPGSMQ
jgi:hypothetical protein